MPDYIAVSHTWGRWRTTPIKYAILPNVPWPIPENTLFSVTELPSLMTQVPSSERYVWFDLLCIPQNRSHPTLGPRAQIEIAKQASIFRNASLAVAWLNWIPNWSGLQGTLEWIALINARCNELDSLDLGEDLIDSYSLANEPTYLLLYLDRQPGMPSKDIASAEPSTWFSSLWTLQEVCLRPEMLLCDKNWRPLRIGHNYSVPLDHIISL